MAPAILGVAATLGHSVRLSLECPPLPPLPPLNSDASYQNLITRSGFNGGVNDILHCISQGNAPKVLETLGKTRLSTAKQFSSLNLERLVLCRLLFSFLYDFLRLLVDSHVQFE